MIFVKVVSSFLSLYFSYVIYAETVYGLPRERRSPQWPINSSLLRAGQESQNILTQTNKKVNQNLEQAIPTAVDNDKYRSANLELGSQHLLGAGLNDRDAWLAVVGQNLTLTQGMKKPQENAVASVKPSPVPQISPTISQQTGHFSQQTGQVPNPAATSEPNGINESRIGIINQKHEVANVNPGMFQVQPVRPENEIL